MALSNAERQARFRANQKARVAGVLAPTPAKRTLPRGAVIAEVAVPAALAPGIESRDLIEGGRELAARMLDELSATTTHLGEIEQAIEEYTADDKDGRRRYAMLKAVNLASRSAVLKNIATVAKTLSEVSAAPGGKKADAAARAGKAAAGKFAAPEMPKLVVNNR